MFSSGEWDVAEYKAKKLISSLSDSLNSAQSIISTSTSCSLTIKKKYSAYINFSDEISTKVSKSIFDICEYLVENHFEDVTKNMNSIDKKIIYHGPCQLRNHGMGQPAVELLRKIPNISIHLSEADCCGVGGTFGYIKGKGDISRSIGRGLMDQVEEVKPDLILCDSETCRWNIEKSSGIKTIHPIQLILESLGLKNQ
jgi:glycerol-3-phosphate dehydrogenase subunit C